MILTSDIQLHAHQNRARTLPNGRNSRLQNGIDCLAQAFDLARKHKETLVINGDLFHDRRSITIDVLHGAVEVFNRYNCVPVIINTGNHDQYLRDGSIHSTSVFSLMPNVTVVDSPAIFNVDGFEVFVHPFTEDEEFFKRQVEAWSNTPSSGVPILMAHQGVSGALLAGTTKAKGHINPVDLRPNFFKWVFLGHYHRPQQIGNNIYYIGSPYEIDEGEAGDEKRLLRLTSQGVDIIPVEGMPKFKKTGVDGLASVSPDDFVTVLCSNEEEVEMVRGSGYNIVLTETPVNLSLESLSDMTPEESVKKALHQLGREDLLAKAMSRMHP